MHSKRKVLVYGATGAQARPVVINLLERGHEPYVLTRNLGKTVDLAAMGAKIAVASLEDPESLRAASTSMDAVSFMIPMFLEKPSEAVQFARNAIDAAKAAGVKLIVWNMSGNLPGKRGNSPLDDSRIDIHAYLKASGIPNIVFEPGLYIENLLGPWNRQAISERNQVAYPISAEKKVGWLPLESFGKLIVAAIERPELAGSHFKVSGVESPTGPELAAIFSAVLKRELSYYAMAPEEIGNLLDTLYGPGAGAPVANAYRRMRDDPTPPPGYHDMSVVLQTLPVRMTGIAEWIEKHIVAFTQKEPAAR